MHVQPTFDFGVRTGADPELRPTYPFGVLSQVYESFSHRADGQFAKSTSVHYHTADHRTDFLLMRPLYGI